MKKKDVAQEHYRIKKFLDSKEVIFKDQNPSKGHLKIWNPMSDSWINYYTTTKVVCDSMNCKIGVIPYKKLERFTMKGKDVRYKD